MKNKPVVKTVPNVPILEVGIEYQLSSGPRTFTPEDLRDAVTAANEDRAIGTPRAGIGHIDPRFNDPKLYDGTPAFGKYTNLRLSENGMAVYADWEGCPAWLADIAPYAFPSRSIEGYPNVKTVTGKEWRFVLTAVKALGIQMPGITVLEDLPMYYGEEIPPGVVIDPALAAAAGLSTGGDPMKVAASANLDDVRQAFYKQYIPARPEAKYMWIRAVLTDPNQVVSEDDLTGQLYVLDFSSDADGNVSFGEPQPVRPAFVPETPEAQKEAAPHVAAMMAIGREVAASYSTQAESRLTTASGGAMNPKLLRESLGLPEDASDEQVQAELLKRAGIDPNGPQQQSPGVAPHDPASTGGVAPVSTGMPEPSPDNAQPDPQPVLPPEAASAATPTPAPAPVTAANLPPGTVLVSQEAWQQVQAGAEAGLELRTQMATARRESVVTAAINDGRIAPSSRDHWLRYLEADPNGETVLASLQKGLIPVGELRSDGRIQPEAVTASLDDDTVQGWVHQLFPETARAAAHESAVAAGNAPRSRISADANFRR